MSIGKFICGTKYIMVAPIVSLVETVGKARMKYEYCIRVLHVFWSFQYDVNLVVNDLEASGFGCSLDQYIE